MENQIEVLSGDMDVRKVNPVEIEAVNGETVAGEEQARPWKRAIQWLMFLGPFFLISYSLANWLASEQQSVVTLVFEWEKNIPFIPWTIVPYWLIDILYVASLFLCVTKTELDSHAKRLLTAQVIAVMFFITLPMGFSFEKPETSGLTGAMFVALESFDQPYNQAPSLHIALLVILWDLYIRHLPRKLIWAFHALSVLIAISVLTTYQHHFIDIPTGALLGWFCVWLWPADGEKMFSLKNTGFRKKESLIAAYYFIASLILFLIAINIGGVYLWLNWPAASLLTVAVIYVFSGAEGFQKNDQGEISVAAKILLFPYLIAAKINSRLWTWNKPPANLIEDDVWLGRYPSGSDVNFKACRSVIDLTAEFNRQSVAINWYSFPCLDLVLPEKEKVLRAADLIEVEWRKGPVLVSCALGYSRSALVVIAWLLISKREADVDAAINKVISKRPDVLISRHSKALLHEICEQVR